MCLIYGGSAAAVGGGGASAINGKAITTSRSARNHRMTRTGNWGRERSQNGQRSIDVNANISDKTPVRWYRQIGGQAVSESSSEGPTPSRKAVLSIDISIPNPARVYDFLLGGKDNFEADRITARAGIDAFPKIAESARASRAFLVRVVRHLAVSGIRQFLDIGTGLPSGNNVHEVAQLVAPTSRIVYVDNDPVVLRHAQALLKSRPEGVTKYVEADMRDPGKILREAAETLDFSQPTGVLLLGVLHFLEDDQEVADIISALMDEVPTGSYLAICHLTADFYPEMTELTRRVNEHQSHAPLFLRSREQVVRFFDGLQLVPPGLVQCSKWRPDSKPEAAAPAALWGGVACKDSSVVTRETDERPSP